jgi:hypothetical protein
MYICNWFAESKFSYDVAYINPQTSPDDPHWPYCPKCGQSFYYPQVHAAHYNVQINPHNPEKCSV